MCRLSEPSLFVCNWYQNLMCWLIYDIQLLKDLVMFVRVRKGAKIRNRYNQAPHLTQDTNGKVTTCEATFDSGCLVL